jgi:hypothetical protein
MNEISNKDEIKILTSPLFSNYNLIHGYPTRFGGVSKEKGFCSLNLYFSKKVFNQINNRKN